MRILFICSQEFDYLQDLTYSGLKEILGKEVVIEFPYHWSYHREKQFFWSRALEYPRNLGFNQDNAPNFNLNQIKKELVKSAFDLVILGSAKPDALRTLEQILDWICVPWVFIDGGDWQEIGGDFRRTGGEPIWKLFKSICEKKAPAVIFKRELSLNNRDENVFPFPFSVHASKVPLLPIDSPKSMDVVFWAVESSSARKEAFRLLNGKYDCNKNGTIAGQTFRRYPLRGDAYFKALNQSKIALSFRGEGFDTLRYWEIPTCGSFLLSEQPTIQIPNNFEYGKHSIFCKNDLSNLTELIDYYLKNETERKEIALAGQKHLLQYHTHLARANYFLEIIRDKLKIS